MTLEFENAKPTVSTKTRHRAVHLLAVGLLAGACATTSFDRQPDPAAPGTYLVTGDQLLMHDGEPSIGPSQEMASVRALTYHSGAAAFYAIAQARTAPQLIVIDPRKGETRTVGPIIAPDLDLKLVEALAYDDLRGKLYAAGGDSTFASGILLEVDPATGHASQVVAIRGTSQNDVDAMTFADGELYAIDESGRSSALYRIDIETGRASRAGKPFDRSIVDLAFDTTQQQLVGVQGDGESLLILSLTGYVVGAKDAPANGATALEIIRPPGGTPMFIDGFESGNRASWSEHSN